MSSKDRVLELLELNKEEYISGELMAEKLGLSRNAVWKAISELRKQGYVIEASSNKGYHLGTSNDIISEFGILSELSKLSPDLDHSGKIKIYESIDSTNRLAKELAITGAPGGTVIIARNQSLGKGRREHEFFSPEGGIYMSIILSPDMLPSLEPDVVTALAGVAVCDSLVSLCGINPRIKPVNDLFVDGKKICGILTESGTEYDTGTVQWIVIGIGINFDSDISKFPKELKDIAGSVFKPGKGTVTKNSLIAAILYNISKLSLGDKKEVLKAYKARLITV